MTVGDIRKAIEGLDDEAGVALHFQLTEESEGMALVELASVAREDGSLVIGLDVTCFGDEFDLDGDDDE